MIIGDPSTFALCVDVVRQWNDDNHFNNGVLCLCVGGTFLPNNLVNATLNTDLYELIGQLENVKEDADIFAMDRDSAFKSIYKLRFPEDYDIDNDYSYDISPYSLSDNSYYVFAVMHEGRIRILGAKLRYIIEEGIHDLNEIDIAETYILVTELHEIVEQLKEYWHSIN